MIRINRVQTGSGGHRPLLVIFHADPSVVKSSLAYIGLSHVAAYIGLTPSGGYGQPPSWASILDQATKEGWPGGPTILAGYSAGCAAVRELLRGGAHPDVVVALDGTHGPRGQVPASADVLAPWRAFAHLAKSGEHLCLFTHTYQSYTEKLSVAERFPCTVGVVRAITGWPLVSGGPVDQPVETREGGLVVLSYASASIDKAAHIAQLQRALPHALEHYVAPWIASHDNTQEESATVEERGTGVAALQVALQELAAEIHEDPMGSNSGPRVKEYLAGCVRDLDRDGDLDPLGLKAANWCAALVGFCDHVAGVPRTWRASVSELCADASASGTLRGLDYDPQPGDLAIFSRDGQSPLKGGLGHVARVELVTADTFVTIDGNHGDRVARVVRQRSDPALVAWIEYPHQPSAYEVLGSVVTAVNQAAGVTGSPESFATYDEGPTPLDGGNLP